jgi:hypothetical protein
MSFVLHQVKPEVLKWQYAKDDRAEFKQVNMSFPLAVFNTSKALCHRNTVNFYDVEPGNCENS